MLGAAVGAAGGVALFKNKRHIKAKFAYLKMRADIERQVQGMKKFTREAYDKVIENALREYGAKAEISAAKLAVIETELKSRWKVAKEKFEETMQEKAAEMKDEMEDTDDADDE